MAGMTPEDYSRQLQPQDCITTVAGLECDTVTHAEEEEGTDYIVAENEVTFLCLPCLGFEDLQDWSDNIVLETASLPLAILSALLCACCNSKELLST
ncbi:hypothetical protein DSO57_1004374 [Entomophthora muscae]|uniref:Uncharacterized protein n=1 Tax=Entomophthora muscae TaxID=34485 RepID=A0ACC2U6K6_9FUNG|nr:hypothetical protein DSO57_1004374 [Entomophthora muscae]